MSTAANTGPDTQTIDRAAAVVRRYFLLAPQQDTAEYFALFAADATAEDEGNEYRGIEQIRRWRTQVPRVSYRIDDIRWTETDLQAQVEISGDFPGSPVTLRFLFQISGDGLITRLKIRT